MLCDIGKRLNRGNYLSRHRARHRIPEFEGCRESGATISRKDVAPSVPRGGVRGGRARRRKEERPDGHGLKESVRQGFIVSGVHKDATATSTTGILA